MKIKKTALVLTGATLILLSLAACGKNNTAKETQTQEESTVSSDEATASDEAAAMEKPESYGDVTKLGEYKGVSVSMDDTTVTDDDVNSQIQNILTNNPTYTDVTDRAAQNGDTVNIDYVGTLDGEAFDGGTAQGYDLELGSGSFIDGFEDGLIGANVGDTKVLELTFPDDYTNTDLAGKATEFTVTVNSIKEKQDATLTDDWVNTYTKGAQTTVADFTEATRQSLEDNKTSSAQETAQYDALVQVIDNSTYDVNPDAVEYEYQQQIAYYTSMATQYGTDLDNLASMYGMSADDLKKQLKSYAEEIVKQQLTIDAIAEAEDMKLDDEDYDYLTKLYGMDKDSLISSYGQEIVDQNTMMYKVVNFLLDNANVTIKPADETSAAGETGSN